MKKLITILVLMVICFYHINPVLATNTHSIDLEKDSSQYLSITDANQTGLDITGDFSFSFWMKRESFNTYQGLISKKGDEGGNYRMYIDSDNRLTGTYLSSTGGTDDVILRVDAGNTSSAWQYITMTADVSEKIIKIYVNNSEQTATYLRRNATSVGTNSGSCFVGCMQNTGDTGQNFLDGLMDEIGIWSRVLTSSEISDIYNSGDGLEYSSFSSSLKTDLEAYWKLDNNLLDETSNNNDLTNNNSAVFSSSVPFAGGEEEEEETFIPQILIY